MQNEKLYKGDLKIEFDRFYFPKGETDFEKVLKTVLVVQARYLLIIHA